MDSMNQRSIDDHSDSPHIIQSSYAPNSINYKDSSDSLDITSVKKMGFSPIGVIDQIKGQNCKEKRKSVIHQDKGLIKKELQRSAMSIK